jgi:hypothetical protein
MFPKLPQPDLRPIIQCVKMSDGVPGIHHDLISHDYGPYTDIMRYIGVRSRSCQAAGPRSCQAAGPLGHVKAKV